MSPSDWNVSNLVDDFISQFNFQPEMPDLEAKLNTEELTESLKKQVFKRLIDKENEFTPAVLEHLMTVLLLQVIDSQWKDHLLSIDHLKEGIGLRGYGQKNPKEEYKREAYNLFMQMMGRIRQEVLQKLFMIQLVQQDDVDRMEEDQKKRKVVMNRSDEADKPAQPVKRDEDKVGRNDPCPCGSGQKYKKCCGR